MRFACLASQDSESAASCMLLRWVDRLGRKTARDNEPLRFAGSARTRARACPTSAQLKIPQNSPSGARGSYQ